MKDTPLNQATDKPEALPTNKYEIAFVVANDEKKLAVLLNKKIQEGWDLHSGYTIGVWRDPKSGNPRFIHSHSIVRRIP